MKTIWKYNLGLTVRDEFEMPRGARILALQTQRSEPCMWVEFEGTPTPLETRVFETFGTGHPMGEKKREFIGTYQLEDGALVFHVYELLEVEQ